MRGSFQKSELSVHADREKIERKLVLPVRLLHKVLASFAMVAPTQAVVLVPAALTMSLLMKSYSSWS